MAAALAAGLVATLVTVLIEKYGGLIGGALGTMPTTIVPAAIGMAIAQNETDLMASLSVVPSGMLVNAIFLSVWIYLPEKLSETSKNRGLTSTTIASLVVWTIVGMSAIFIIEEGKTRGFSSKEIASIGVILTAAFGLTLGWNPRETPSGTNKVSKSVLIARGTMAATAIGISVWVAGLGYPLIAGLASVFPAIFLTSMVALWISQGSSVPRGAAAPMLLGGGSVGLYALVAMTTLGKYGLIWGTIFAWFAAVIFWSLPAYSYLNWRNSQLRSD
tara:strand:- start:1086 stop:1907 length:822 start_codon:yes stop_codon:yes gene_type:complete